MRLMRLMRLMGARGNGYTDHTVEDMIDTENIRQPPACGEGDVFARMNRISSDKTDRMSMRLGLGVLTSAAASKEVRSLVALGSCSGHTWGRGLGIRGGRESGPHRPLRDSRLTSRS